LTLARGEEGVQGGSAAGNQKLAAELRQGWAGGGSKPHCSCGERSVLPGLKGPSEFVWQNLTGQPSTFSKELLVVVVANVQETKTRTSS